VVSLGRSKDLSGSMGGLEKTKKKKVKANEKPYQKNSVVLAPLGPERRGMDEDQ